MPGAWHMGPSPGRPETTRLREIEGEFSLDTPGEVPTIQFCRTIARALSRSQARDARRVTGVRQKGVEWGHGLCRWARRCAARTPHTPWLPWWRPAGRAL